MSLGSVGWTREVAVSRPGAEHIAAGVFAAGALCVVSAGAVGGQEAFDGPVLCPFRLATGLPCPLCGTTRSLVALGDGDLGQSLSFQPFGPLVPLLAVLLLAAVVSTRLRELVWTPRSLRIAAVVVASTWVVQLGRVAA